MVDISEMHLVLHLSNGHFFLKKIFITGIGSGKGHIKKNQSEDFFP